MPQYEALTTHCGTADVRTAFRMSSHTKAGYSMDTLADPLLQNRFVTPAP
jgi:hypothetical protein